MLEQLYKEITLTTLRYQKYGIDEFNDTSGTPHGFLGDVVADVATLLVGFQNILASHLDAPAINLDVGNPNSMRDDSQFLSALKSVHRYFTISLQTAIDSAAGRLCSERGYPGTLYGEKAFKQIVQELDKEERSKCETLYEAVKVIRNACAHSFDGKLNNYEKEKLRNADLGFLISGDELVMNPERYQPITKKANECISLLQKEWPFLLKRLKCHLAYIWPPKSRGNNHSGQEKIHTGSSFSWFKSILWLTIHFPVELGKLLSVFTFPDHLIKATSEVALSNLKSKLTKTFGWA